MRIEQFDLSVDILSALIWERNKSINLQTLLELKQQWYDENQTAFWQDWYRDVFNLQTANNFGLHVWSFILDIPIQLGPPPDPPDKPIFGFDIVPSENTYFNFDNGTFSNGGTGYNLEQKRLILRLRYFQLVTRGAFPEINAFLKAVFSHPGTGYVGQVYGLDGLNMTITYVFTNYIPAGIVSILRNYDLLPRPAGVGLWINVDNGAVFGFDEFAQNFDNGCFMEEVLDV